VECDAVPAPAVITATDNCDAVSTVDFNEIISGTDCDAVYTIIRTWSVADCSGNGAFAIQTISVVDTQAPEFLEALPADLTVECDDVPDEAVLTATDNCDAMPTVSMTEEISNELCTGSYTLTRTWTAADCAGNTEIHIQVITVEDTTSPSRDSEAMDLTVECDGAGNGADLNAWLASNGGASATDACSGVTWSNDFAALSDDCGTTGAATVNLHCDGRLRQCNEHHRQRSPSKTRRHLLSWTR
jgi:hypothetical protein